MPSGTPPWALQGGDVYHLTCHIVLSLPGSGSRRCSLPHWPRGARSCWAGRWPCCPSVSWLSPRHRQFRVLLPTRVSGPLRAILSLQVSGSAEGPRQECNVRLGGRWQRAPGHEVHDVQLGLSHSACQASSVTAKHQCPKLHSPARRNHWGNHK